MLTGTVFLDAVLDAYTLMGAHAERLNAMNVYPVPDGDTGTNLLRTLSGVRALSATADEPLSSVSRRVAVAMLEKARGNSGILLSLLFRGFSHSFHAVHTANAEQLADALTDAFDCAWNCMPNPREGTILTVARIAAQSARAVSDKTLQTVMTAACDGACKALSATTAMLPQLQASQVVDAGGYGYLLVLRAFAERLGGSYVPQTFALPCEISAVRPDFKYCTELWIRGKTSAAATAELQRFLTLCGDCGTAVSEQDRIKIHVHTNTPWRVLEKALEHGSVYDIKIDDMAEQIGQRG